MASQLNQSDVASFDRRIAEIRKTGGNPSSYCRDVGKQPASSPAAVRQFEADLSHFEAVFARGMTRINQVKISDSLIFIPHHMDTSQQKYQRQIENPSLEESRSRRPLCYLFTVFQFRSAFQPTVSSSHRVARMYSRNCFPPVHINHPETLNYDQINRHAK